MAAATAMEKPQPQVAAVASPSLPANIKIGYAQSYPYQCYYPYFSTATNDSHNVPSCGILNNENFENREGGIAYQLRPLAPSCTYGPRYSSTYKYPASDFQHQTKTPVHILSQTQLQQYQNTQQNQTPPQQTKPQHQRPLQQMHMQQRQQAQLLQQVLQDSSAPRQNIRMDFSANMEDFRKWR